MDENCWSRSIEGGMLEDRHTILLKRSISGPYQPQQAPDKPEKIRLEFTVRYSCALNGKKLAGYELIQNLNKRAGKHGIGRNDMVEDRILGLKARENYDSVQNGHSYGAP